MKFKMKKNILSSLAGLIKSELFTKTKGRIRKKKKISNIRGGGKKTFLT